MNTHRPHRRTVRLTRHGSAPDQARLWCSAAALAGAVVLSVLTGQPAPATAAAATPASMRPTTATGGSLPLHSALPPSPTAAPGAATTASTAVAGAAGGATVADGSRIPLIVWDAYRSAQHSVAASDPGCRMEWTVLAGIGQVESGQADNGNVTADGTTRTAILGPLLDGTGGNAAIPAPGGGWVRAVGPMQFLPSTWAVWGADGNGDGIADPNNIYDAALAAGRYLCAGGRDLAIAADLDAAILSYNDSANYLATVTAWITYYAHASQSGQPAVSAPATTAPSARPTGTATAAPSRTPQSPVAPRPTRTSSPTPAPTGTASGTPTGAPTGTPTGAPSPSGSASACPSPTGSGPVPTGTSPLSPTPTASTPSPSAPSGTSTPTATGSPTQTPTPVPCAGTSSPAPTSSAGTTPLPGAPSPSGTP
ncbi:lytic murein transglycosylase [Streptacidiphilus sp. MAP5-3]|uniref:lytic murein transglycosylase n=1 Tax=unclassified Streptacidiphilus TaxID=2643834 RepID=UPI003511848F